MVSFLTENFKSLISNWVNHKLDISEEDPSFGKKKKYRNLEQRWIIHCSKCIWCWLKSFKVDGMECNVFWSVDWCVKNALERVPRPLILTSSLFFTKLSKHQDNCSPTFFFFLLKIFFFFNFSFFSPKPCRYIDVYSLLWVLLVVVCGTLPQRGLMSSAMSVPRIRTNETLGRLQRSART